MLKLKYSPKLFSKNILGPDDTKGSEISPLECI